MMLLALSSDWLGVVASLGLASLGWGGVTAFFSHRAFVVLAILLGAASVVALFTKSNLSAGEREDRTNRWVLVALGSIGLLLGYLPAYADRREIWTLDGETVRWLGLVILPFGAALRMWPIFVLGRLFSGLVAIQPGHTLVTSGIYAIIRNPSYLGMLVVSVGWALVFRSGIGLVLTAFMIVPVVVRIQAEEGLLRSHFGAAYDVYCSRTSRLIPGLY